MPSRPPHVAAGWPLLCCVLIACGGTMHGSVEPTNQDAGALDASGPSGGSDEAPDQASPEDAAADAGHVSPAGAIDSEQAGPYAVGTFRTEIGATGGRVLPLQVWYPAVEAARREAQRGRPLEDFEPAGPRHEALSALVATAPDGCTNKTMHAADAPKALIRDEPWPLVVFSHCLDCTRFSSFSSAERMASWGFVVAAPDHEGGTLYDAQAGSSAGMTGPFLETRARDISSVIDVLLDPKTAALPTDLRGTLDADNVGVFGHSYGSVTAGLVLQKDARVKAGVMIAAPPESPFPALAGKVSLSAIEQPSLFLLAREDNSITELGNIALRNNYTNYPNEAWLVEVIDAGHWSFSDICGLVDSFDAGCGEGTRQVSMGAPFSYLDNELARGIAAAYTLAYFGKELTQDAVAGEYLKSPKPTQYVTIEHHK